MKDALHEKLADFAKWAHKALKRHAEGDAEDALTNMRKAGEAACKVLLIDSRPVKHAEQLILEAKGPRDLVQAVLKHGSVTREVVIWLESLHTFGNTAAHDDRVDPQNARIGVEALRALSSWLYKERIGVPMPAELGMAWETDAPKAAAASTASSAHLAEELLERMTKEQASFEQRQSKAMDASARSIATREWRQKSKESDGIVDAEIISEVISKMTGVPLTRLSSEDTVRLLAMEGELHKRVVSQDEGIKLVCKAVRRSRSGLKDPKRPMATFLFSGPTGVGKTLLAKTLAEFMFGDEDALVQIDMSEYQERHNISRLIGAPPGFVGFEEGGQLTERIRRRPYAVVLLDEIEKAHPDVYNMLLQIMEEGHLTDSFGRKVDFKNTILIMTTNVGAKAIASPAFGFSGTDATKQHDDMKKNVMAEVSRVFKPEFIGRLDEIVVFNKLTDENMQQIVEIELGKVRERLRDRGLNLLITPEAKQLIILKSRGDADRDSSDYGARPLRRAVEQFIEDPLSEELLRGAFNGKNRIIVKTRDVGGDKQLDFEGVVGEGDGSGGDELVAAGVEAAAAM